MKLYYEQKSFTNDQGKLVEFDSIYTEVEINGLITKIEMKTKEPSKVLQNLIVEQLKNKK